MTETELRAHAATAPEESVSTGIVSASIRIFDFVAICAASAVAHWFWLAGEVSAPWTTYMLVTVLAALFAVNAQNVAGSYKWDRLSVVGSSLYRTLAIWAGVLALLVLVAFVTKTSDQFSRAWFLLWFGAAGMLLGISRIVLYLAILDWKAQGRLARNVVVYGMGEIGEQLVAKLVSLPGNDIRIRAFFDDRLSRVPDFCWRVPLMGNTDDLIEYVRNHPVDSVLVALPPTADERISHLLDQLSVVPVDVQLCTGTMGLRLDSVQLNNVCGIPMLGVVSRPLSGWRHAVKGMEDVLLGSLILLLISPLLALIALAIKLDSPGPVFFRQKRYGFNNQLIEVFKFRTMYVDRTDADAAQLTQRNDPRVTRLGRFLRKSSLDELPQFFNVLRGEMSIVGPRPHALQAKADGILYQDAVKQYAARHRVKPGITGLAQINGWRGETRTVEQIEQRVRHDLTYIENWSLGLDLKIIVLTAFTGFTSSQAY
ncbi:MAG: undecaprenyl-phosphate glucose phosphotransferase [Rhodospirillaceae bacterium]